MGILFLVETDRSFACGTVNPSVIHPQEPFLQLFFQILQVLKSAAIQKVLFQVVEWSLNLEIFTSFTGSDGQRPETIEGSKIEKLTVKNRFARLPPINTRFLVVALYLARYPGSSAR